MDKKSTLDEVARELNIPIIDLHEKKPLYESLSLVSEDVAAKKRIIIFELHDDFMKAAVENPFSEDNIAILEGVKKKTGKRIELFLATPESITYGLEWYKDKEVKEEENTSQVSERKIREEKDSKKDFVSIEELIDHAISFGASKIHIECRQKTARIFYHIKKLHTVAEAPESIGMKLVTQVKDMAHIDQGHIHMHGDFCMIKKNKYYHVVVTSFPLPVGEKLNLEIDEIDKDRHNLEHLGMEESQIKDVKKALENPSGIFFVTGPEGSGRSSTMYAFLRLLVKKDKKIATLENPIECFMDDVIQVRVNPLQGLTYMTGLKNVSTYNPDVIMTEGVRDSETLNTVFELAQKGKIIIAPLNAKSIFSVFSHLESMGITREKISENIKLIINQRLVLRLCAKCKKQKDISNDEKVKIEQELSRLPKLQKQSNIKLKAFRPSSCKSCDLTGFFGHVGLFESLLITENVKKSILDEDFSKPENSFFAKQNILSLYQDGLIKVIKGITIINEIQRVIK